jgi:hydroxymethylpyrimidine pyrophosphatase-like HAD family hydrolase
VTAGTRRIPAATARMRRVRCLYVDLDGTLLGRGGVLLRDGEGSFSLLGARALEACARADVEVVVVTGRRRDGLREVVRLLGVTSYVFEIGGGLVLDGEVQWLGGEGAYGSIAESGAPALLREHFDLEPHAPWDAGREVSHLLRGDADVTAANALLARHGHDDLRLLDNGHSVYHLVPAGISKAAGVAAHMQARGYGSDECIAVGDSGEDVALAEHVGTFWLVANAQPAAFDVARGLANVRRSEEGFGAGVYEAVLTTLAERR